MDPPFILDRERRYRWKNHLKANSFILTEGLFSNEAGTSDQMSGGSKMGARSGTVSYSKVRRSRAR